MKNIEYIVETDSDTLTFPVNHEGLEAAINVAQANRTNVDVRKEHYGKIELEEVWNFVEANLCWARSN